MTISAGTRLGPYEILAPLGAGGMGEVYRARDAKLKRDVAIKVLPEALARDSEALARFEREALAVAALSHPGILSIFDFGTHDGLAYAVMELLEGGTLRDRLQAGAIPIAKSVALAREIAEGLAAAHAKGIVHRDLKPENLFVTRDGRLKILDFGLARRTDEARDDETSAPTLKKTEPGTVMGTVGYMSPEQVRGIPVDHRSDVFSLGVVLYELLSGRRAFKKGTAAETMTAILNEEPDELSADGREVPPVLDRITRRCLEKDPAQRFQSARDVAFALEAASETSTSRTKAVASSPPSPRRAWRAIGLLAAAAVAGALLSRALWKPPAAPLPRYRQVTFKKGKVLNARFGPDGKTVVYSAAWDGTPTEIYTSSVGSRESKPVGIKNASLLAVAPSGELAVSLRKGFLREFSGRGTLARVAPDGGAPREILNDALGADFTPDGKELAILRPEGVSWSIEMPIGKRIFGPSVEINPTGDLRVSPDGSMVATYERTPDGVAVMTIDASGRKVTRSRSYPTLGGLAWDRAGKEIWFATVAEGELVIQVAFLSGGERTVLKLPDGVIVQDLSPDGRLLVELSRGRRDLQVLVPGEERERTLSWFGSSTPVDISPDGRQVLFTERGAAKALDQVIFVRGTDGSPAVRLGEGQAFAFSPDGRFVLATIGDPSRLALVPIGAGESKTIDQGPIDRISRATFHPDGKTILLDGSAKGARRRIWRVGSTGPPAPISPEGVGFVGRAVSPDGNWVVAFRDLGNFFLHSLEGQPERAMPGDTSNTRLLGWSDDGKWLYVVPEGETPGPIDRFDPITGRRERHRERIPPDATSVTSTRGDVITRDGRGYAYDCGWTATSDLWIIEGLK